MTAAASPMTRPATLLGIALFCGAGLFFALLDTTAKYSATVLGVQLAQVIWMRFAANTLLNIIVLGPKNVPELLAARRPGLQLWRGLAMCGSTALNFLAITYLRLDQSITIFFLGPLVVAALAGPLLGEWIGWRRLIAIGTGFLGILVVVRPGFGGIHWAIIFSFGAMLSYSFYLIATRYLASIDKACTTQFYTPLVGLVLFSPLAFLSGPWPSDPFAWLLLCSLGLYGGFGHWLLIQAHRFAPAPVLSPFVYVQLIWMTTMGYLVFGDQPDVWTLAGGSIVIGSGLYLLYREQQTKRRAAATIAASALASGGEADLLPAGEQMRAGRD